MVGMVGLEPTRVLPRRILSPVRLPISPHAHLYSLYVANGRFTQDYLQR